MILEEGTAKQFKVGDIVIIKNNLIPCEDCIVTLSMRSYQGKQAQILSIVAGCRYHLDIDNGNWCWVDQFLERVESIYKPKKQFKAEKVAA